MEVVLGNLLFLGLRDFFGEVLAGGEGVSRGDSCGDRSELMSIMIAGLEAEGMARLTSSVSSMDQNTLEYFRSAHCCHSQRGIPKVEG